MCNFLRKSNIEKCSAEERDASSIQSLLKSIKDKLLIHELQQVCLKIILLSNVPTVCRPHTFLEHNRLTNNNNNSLVH